jgi:RNA polymerase sigma factor (TIGR02999 family)
MRLFPWRGCPDLLDENTQPSISLLIGAAEQGDKAATDALFGTLYAELRRMAKRELGKRAGFVSISATTLLHEAYLDMSVREGQSFPDRARFMAYAARVMRTLIIDHARERHAEKRGGLFEITSLSTNAMENSVDHREVSQIGDALDELAKVEPKLAETVDLKFFCGLTFVEIAALRDVSERTVQRNWERARLYLHRQIRTDLPV